MLRSMTVKQFQMKQEKVCEEKERKGGSVNLLQVHSPSGTPNFFFNIAVFDGKKHVLKNLQLYLQLTKPAGDWNKPTNYSR